MFDIFYSGIAPKLSGPVRAADTIEQAQQLSRTRYFWWVNYLTDYNLWDFLWEPVPWENTQRHAWASQWQKDAGTYLIPRNGYTATNYHQDKQLIRLISTHDWQDIKDNFDYSWHPDPTDPPLVYQFGTQHQKTGGPRYIIPGAVDTKYIRTPYYNKHTQDNNWRIPANVDIETFDFTWHPDATDPPYRYQFGTQHQRTGGPEYIVDGALDTKFVDQIRIRTQRTAQHVYVVDHLDDNIANTLEQIKNNIDTTTTSVRYFDNYLDTLRRIARTADKAGHEFVWICSSVCDYSTFDFTWHPEQWQAGMLHVFASDTTKFGDTFFMHVPTFAYRADSIELLDWYDINYMDINVPRRPLPVIYHNKDTHVEAVKQINFNGPLAIFTTQDNLDYLVPAVSLWREKTKTIVPLSAGAGITIIPKVCVPYIKKQLYDYPNILRTQRHLYSDTPLDVVFIDNNESNADDNYEHLCQIVKNNRIHRSSGVNGRVAAYRAAAYLSCTTWFFAVFAKLKIDNNFNFAWQPDRLQEPKHYIFHARNPVNGLEYGHMSMIAYNKKLVLENTALGLDFTLDQAHEVVPVVSGVANYHYDAWTCWRTAFRECVKLRDSLPDVENEYRLNQWLTQDNTEEQWSRKGAEDAVEYYDSVSGNFAELKRSYDWAWLATYAMIKRNLEPDRLCIPLPNP